MWLHRGRPPLHRVHHHNSSEAFGKAPSVSCCPHQTSGFLAPSRPALITGSAFLMYPADTMEAKAPALTIVASQQADVSSAQAAGTRF